MLDHALSARRQGHGRADPCRMPGRPTQPMGYTFAPVFWQSAAICRLLRPGGIHHACIRAAHTCHPAGAWHGRRHGIERQGRCGDHRFIVCPRHGPADRPAVYGADPEVHHRSLVQFAADRLPARLRQRAHAGQGTRPHRRRAGLPAPRGRRPPLLPRTGRRQSAGEGVLDRQERGRPRDDRGGDRRRKPAGRPRREQGAPGQAGRPAQHRHGRRRRRPAGRAVHAGLLHHRHHPLHRDRLAHRADGTGLPAGGGRRAVHPAHPLARDHPDHADRRGRRS